MHPAWVQGDAIGVVETRGYGTFVERDGALHFTWREPGALSYMRGE